MNKITLTIEVTFSGDIKGFETDIMRNVCYAIKYEVDSGYGITPDELEEYTTNVSATDNNNNNTFNLKLV